MKRDLLYDLSSIMSRAAQCYVFSVFLCLGKPMPANIITWTVMLVLCVSVVFYLFRRLINNPILFLLIHLAAACLAFLAIPAGFQFGFACGLVFLLADSFYCRLKKSGPGEYSVHWSLAVFLCVLYILGAAYRLTQFTTVCFYGVACFLGCFFLSTGLSRTNAFLTDNNALSNVPVDQIRSRVGSVLLAFSVLVLAVMVVAPKTVLMSAVIALQNGVLFVIRKLLGLIDVGEPAVMQETEQIDLGGVFNQGIFEKDGAVSPIWDILDNIVFILVYAAIVVGVIALVVYIYGRVKALFSAIKDVSEDETERIVPDKTERVFFHKKKGGKKIEGPTENVKIRKLYKRYVLAAMRRDVSPSETPGEIGRQIGGNDIRELYEKARYSDAVCTKEEVEKLKSMVQQKKKG